jgi:hypothetical protein
LKGGHRADRDQREDGDRDYSENFLHCVPPAYACSHSTK